MLLTCANTIIFGNAMPSIFLDQMSRLKLCPRTSIALEVTTKQHTLGTRAFTVTSARYSGKPLVRQRAHRCFQCSVWVFTVKAGCKTGPRRLSQVTSPQCSQAPGSKARQAHCPIDLEDILIRIPRSVKWGLIVHQYRSATNVDHKVKVPLWC